MNPKSSVLFVLFLLFASNAFAQESESPKAYPARDQHSIQRATSAIRVDGTLDEQAWKDATALDLEWEWSPGDNVPSVVETRCFITYDDVNLYVAFDARDPEPSAIRAHFADRDTPFLDDTVGFTIDPFNDSRRGFQFRVNPLGIQMEAVNSDVDGSEDWSWNIIWDSIGRVTETGYIVEVAIPFSQLRFPRSSDVQTWGFLATRDYPRSVRHRLRSTYFDRNKNCFICQLEPMAGFGGMKQGRNIELDPTLTAAQTDTRNDFPDGDIESGNENIEIGLTTRWNVTPNIALNAAINPDFSQVEADSAQLDINQSFALFFPERRPFFLEGADFFGTPLRTVFTRSIADPKFGLKLTGKEGGNAFGLFVTQDRRNNIIAPGFQGSRLTSVEEDVLGTVLRYRRDVGDSSTIGVLYAGREGDDNYHNRVFGTDGFLRISDSDTIRFQLVGSDTQYDDAVAQRLGQQSGSFDGLGGRFAYSHAEREWFWNVNYTELEPDFRADSGFITRVGYRQASSFVQRTVWGKDDTWYNRLELSAGVDATEQLEGEANEWGADIGFSAFSSLQSFINVNLAPNHEYFDGVHYDNFRTSIYAEFRPTGDLYLWNFFGFGETIDRSNSRQADFVDWEVGGDFNLGSRIRGEWFYIFNELEVEGGQHLFDVNLVETRLIYHLNLRSFVRLILQYEAIDFSPELYRFPVPEETEDLFSQLLFSYKLNAQTVFLAGYADSRSGFDQIGLTTASRSYFVKIGYAWLY